MMNIYFSGAASDRPTDRLWFSYILINIMLILQAGKFHTVQDNK